MLCYDTLQEFCHVYKSVVNHVFVMLETRAEKHSAYAELLCICVSISPRLHMSGAMDCRWQLVV